jgi:hypothetical protein
MDLNLIRKFIESFFLILILFSLKNSLPIFYAYLHPSIKEFAKKLTYLFNNLNDDYFINSKKPNKETNI